MRLKFGDFELKKFKCARTYRPSERLVLSAVLSSKENQTGENIVTGSSSRYNPPNRWGLKELKMYASLYKRLRLFHSVTADSVV